MPIYLYEMNMFGQNIFFFFNYSELKESLLSKLFTSINERFLNKIEKKKDTFKNGNRPFNEHYFLIQDCFHSFFFLLGRERDWLITVISDENRKKNLSHIFNSTNLDPHNIKSKGNQIPLWCFFSSTLHIFLSFTFTSNQTTGFSYL